jgi:hypothetical protein
MIAGLAFIFLIVIGLGLLEASGRLRAVEGRRRLRLAAALVLSLSMVGAAWCAIPVLFRWS